MAVIKTCKTKTENPRSYIQEYEYATKATTCLFSKSSSPSLFPSSSTSSFSFYHTSSLSLGGGSPKTWGHVNNWKVKAKLKALEEKDKGLLLSGSSKGKGKDASSFSSSSQSKSYDFSEENIIRLDDNLKEGVLEEFFASLKSETVSNDPKSKWKSQRKKVNMKQLFGPGST